MTAQLQAHSALISPDLKTTSLIVAEKFNKRHKDVLRAVYSLDVSRDFTERNFAPREEIRRHRTGATRKIWVEMTRDGFSLLVMGFTGRAAMGWKIKFLEAFNAMEAAIRTSAPVISPDCVVVSKSEWEKLKQAYNTRKQLIEGIDAQTIALRQVVMKLGFGVSWGEESSEPPKLSKAPEPPALPKPQPIRRFLSPPSPLLKQLHATGWTARDFAALHGWAPSTVCRAIAGQVNTELGRKMRRAVHRFLKERARA